MQTDITLPLLTTQFKVTIQNKSLWQHFYIILYYRAHKKIVPSGHLGQVDFLAGQVTVFNSLAQGNGQGS